MSDSLFREPSVEEISKPRIKQKQDEPLISKILTYLFFLNDLFPIQSWWSKKRQTSRIRWWMLMTKIGSHYALLECLNGRAGGILDPLVSEIVSAHTGSWAQFLVEILLTNMWCYMLWISISLSWPVWSLVSLCLNDI